MLPNDEYMEEEIEEDLQLDFEIEEEPNLTYALKNEKIVGKYDELEAVKQAVIKILNTERYKHEIYSWDYGVELKDLLGMDIEDVMYEVDTRITEALTADDRIEDVTDFEMEQTDRHTLHVSFTVVSTQGEFESEVNVSV